MGTIDLNRRRILLVDNDHLLATAIIDEIEDHNGIVLAHAVTLVEGIGLLDRERPDACILNIRLGSDMVYPLADRLLAEGIPFIFASSEARADIPDRFAEVHLHSKPIEMVRAAAGLMGTIAK